jgi:trk system potassium uptake protein
MIVRRVLDLWRGLSAPALFVASFATLILVGTLGFLVLPGLYTAEPLSFVDALFTATSAACVTGLIVVDTASHFTVWGQLWLLLLFQLGGLGLIGMTSAIIGVMGRRLSLRTEMIAAPSLHEIHGHEVFALVIGIMKFTFGVELVLALVLFVQWLPDFGAAQAAWHALFQAVSAFCNAGFSTFSDSLEGFARRPFIVVPMSLAIVIGGFGYLSLVELTRWSREGGARGPRRLSTHTHAALSMTLLLLFVGAAVFVLLEWNGVLRGQAVADKIVNAWFMSVTARTAGFNTVPYDQIGNQAAYVTIFLMFVGGSPGSTAGGIKTTALAILVAVALSRIRGRRFVQLHDRTIPEVTVGRTVSLIVLFFLLLAAVNFVLTLSETRGEDIETSRVSILPLLFEAVSAAGTVGLSMGVTPSLTPIGKLTIILTMFIGRVGPLAFFAALSIKRNPLPSNYRPAREDVIVG